MDSMLDTLTNVVGILIIVLVTVQLSSQEAASRIAASVEQLDPEEATRIHERAAAVTAAADRLHEQVVRLKQARKGDPAAETARLEAAAIKAEAAAAEVAARAAAIEKEKSLASMAARRLADERARKAAADIAKAEAEATAAERNRQSLAAELEKTVSIPLPPAKEVRLPDPRPAPANAKELRVVCREDTIWVVDMDELRERAQKRVAYVVRMKKLDPDNDRWLSDGEALVDKFNDSPVITDEFEMTLALAGTRPQLVLTRRPGSGQATEKAVRPGGDLTRLLQKHDPKDSFIRFYVWPDGFEAYLAARQAAGAAGFAAGWEPVASPTEHALSLGKYSVGTKPPPTPSKPKKPATPVLVD